MRSIICKEYQLNLLRMCGITQAQQRNGGHQDENINEMSKDEMKAEIAFAEDFVNKGGRLDKAEWSRLFKMMELVKED